MTFSADDASTPTPGSPPDLTSSKSSKSSSFHSSYQSDNDGINQDLNHFEDIGLDDDARSESEDVLREPTFKPYTATYVHELRTSVKRPSIRSKSSMQRELTNSSRPAYPSLRGPVRQATGDVQVTMGLRAGAQNPYLRRGLTSPSAPTLGLIKRNRSTSPNTQPLSPRNLPVTSQRIRRGSWQSNRERKTIKELEKECEEDDGDELPDDVLLENVPMSPRPMSERRSLPPSPDREAKQKEKMVKPAGNGTPATPVAQGCLRSPANSKPPMEHRAISMGQFPIHHDSFSRQPRAKSWTAALSELGEEAKALTEALEAHADELSTAPPKQRRSVSSAPMEKRRVQSSIAELPPLRKTEDMMIDPLPISKEKEAVLSRTRPSWLPPKNPQEEKKHIKEYQRMMALSLEAERKKEAERRVRESCKDNTYSSLARIWEEHVLPNWDAVVPMKRTRELWWRGISPRSRGKVWQRAVGNELNLSANSYLAALRRAKDLERKLAKGDADDNDKRHGRWFSAIRKDIETTFPELRIFQEGGPLNTSLIDVVSAYSMYRSDVGYVPGLTTIVALLLLNLPTPESAFITLCNVLNRALPNAFLTHDPMAIHKYLSLTMATLQAKFPTLYQHLESPERPSISLSKQPDIYLISSFTSLFTSNLDLESMTRLWDVWVFEGDAVLVRAAVALFECCESRLYGCNTKSELLEVLANPDVSGAVGGKGPKDEERWMKAVRDAGRGTRSGAYTGPSSDIASPNGPRSPNLSNTESNSPNLKT